ncbi:MAG: ChbG/HpnK family deacetylase [Desulfovibrio sp.]|jgi:predicted glycoside hydrolase/deacetylase ChbG (UPF0249 family)|nr:ChbG/HpnK family deacetylase [Desulfovibrio sp.]
MRCFFQADDGGLCAGVTEGIVSCLDRGPLAGVGIIMGAPHDAEAAALLGTREHIALTIHLNLLEGRPAAPPRRIPSLAGKDGCFHHSLATLAAELFFGGRTRKNLFNSIEMEFRAQIERFRALLPGRPLRLDSHLHVHVLPPLRPLLRILIREYGVSYVRVPAELFHIPAAPPAEQIAGQTRRALLAAWASPLRALLEAEGVRSGDFFVGAFASGRMTLDKLRASLLAVRRKGAGGETVEIMVHPGGLRSGEEADVKPAYRGFYASAARETERNMLASPALPALLESLNMIPYFPGAGA